MPLGTIYSTNLTPDKDTGIGTMPDDAFVRAVRAGEGTKGHLYPAMPYTSYAGLSREDVLAIKSYRDSLPPINQATPANALGFPFDQRWGMAFWNVIFFREHRYVPDPHREAQWNRGAYLATALGHCGECHPPRNVGFAMSTRNYLSGATIEGWKAYNATSDAEYGIGNWTDAQLTGYLSRGLVAGRRAASGPMAEVVQDSLQYVTPSDIGALLVYLRTIAPQKGVASSGINLQPPAFNASNAVLPGTIDASNSRGRQIFDGNCAGCHRRDGKGRESAYASLKGSHAVNDTAGSAPIQVLLRGTQLKVGAATHTMPGFGAIYSDADIAAVANYVVAHFGNKQATVSAPDVQRARQAQ